MYTQVLFGEGYSLHPQNVCAMGISYCFTTTYAMLTVLQCRQVESKEKHEKKFFETTNTTFECVFLFSLKFCAGHVNLNWEMDGGGKIQYVKLQSQLCTNCETI